MQKMHFSRIGIAEQGEQGAETLYLYLWHLFSLGFHFFIFRIIPLWMRYLFGHLPEVAHMQSAH